uniref:ACB domain-containing protein n=1 Tax=Haemonchus contortus TaxID=6289 RepID=A0A7I4YDV8_HAECO
MSQSEEASTAHNQSGFEHISANDSNIDEKFQAAVDIVASLPIEGPVTTTTDEKLAFYSFYKQATIGPCNTPKPSFWNVVEKFKWDAWNNLGTMEANEAKAAYVHRLLKKIKDVNKEHDTGEWLQGELYERLVPKFAVIGLYPYDRQLRPKLPSDDDDTTVGSVTTEAAFKRPETIGEEELMSDGSFDNSTSDVYLDANEKKHSSKASSRHSSSSRNFDPEPRDRTDSDILKRYTSRIEGELKVISRQISHLNAEAEHRHCSLRNMFKRATFRLFAPQRISWRAIVILIVWPFVANMLWKMFRNLIGF